MTARIDDACEFGDDVDELRRTVPAVAGLPARAIWHLYGEFSDEVHFAGWLSSPVDAAGFQAWLTGSWNPAEGEP